MKILWRVFKRKDLGIYYIGAFLLANFRRYGQYNNRVGIILRIFQEKYAGILN